MKNTGAFVCGLLGAIFGLIGGILWTACADVLNSAVTAAGGNGGSMTIYLVCFIVLGIGGAVLALIGSIQSFHFKKGGFALTLLGFLFQVGHLVANCVGVGGFSFLLNICTLVSIILLLVATILARKKPPVQE
ncbi:MAG: hypothetical protein NC132_01710 [Corallococcus sp.]|nr:hypothetical protein [Corallococcus sp.]MCM1359374.1 hypothetical protein [Corallococcus sp.]MCM1394817.1 hypothetical protein [Corallococcus sp.]